ncbi:MAG: lasso peptide biosynthesis PqqD family chaperone [Pseudomonadota bacterium]
MTSSGYVLPDHVMCQRTGDAMVLLDTQKGQYFELNDTACAAFLNLLEGKTLTGAAERLVEEFDVTEAQALKDVETLLEDLLTSGLVCQAADQAE